MTTNSIPPVLVERADTRPIRLVPLRATRAWATFTATSSGIAGVALITDAGAFGEAPAGSLSFEVKEKP